MLHFISLCLYICTYVKGVITMLYFSKQAYVITCIIENFCTSFRYWLSLTYSFCFWLLTFWFHTGLPTPKPNTEVTLSQGRKYVRFTKSQRQLLESVYRIDPNPNSSFEEKLSGELNVDVLKIRRWFSARRRQLRKRNSKILVHVYSIVKVLRTIIRFFVVKIFSCAVSPLQMRH